MNLRLVRKEYRPDGIFGELRDEQGALIACTLEHAYGDDQTGYHPKVPSGEFKCIQGLHRLHGMDSDFTTFEITGVEGHSNILFHWGNYNKDSEGCVLLGKDILKSDPSWMITESRLTFSKFMQIQDGMDSFQISVVG